MDGSRPPADRYCRIAPEAMKPRRIAINANTPASIEQKKAA